MKYTVKARPTVYRGVRFRSRLEARWAAFFDCIEWQWKYEPVDLQGWTPDFWVSFPCTHSECERTYGQRDGSHELYIEVKPYYRLDEFVGHPVTRVEPYSHPAPARFGIDPSVTAWEMAHGAGGGLFTVEQWEDCPPAWTQAGNAVQWSPVA